MSDYLFLGFGLLAVVLAVIVARVWKPKVPQQVVLGCGLGALFLSAFFLFGIEGSPSIPARGSHWFSRAEPCSSEPCYHRSDGVLARAIRGRLGRWRWPTANPPSPKTRATAAHLYSSVADPSELDDRVKIQTAPAITGAGALPIKKGSSPGSIKVNTA